MSFLTSVLSGICILYIFIIAYSVYKFIINDSVGQIWYYLTCYSFGALFTLRFLSLVSVTNKAINVYGFEIPVTKSVAKTDVFNMIRSVCSADSDTIMTLFFMNIILYLIVLFVLKMVTNMNTFRIKSVFYCFLLLLLVSKTVKVGVSFEAYFTLLVFAIALYLFSFFGKNILKNIRQSLRESINSYRRNKNSVEQSKRSNYNKNSHHTRLNGEYYEKENANGDSK